MISKYIYHFIIVKKKKSYTNKASKINTGNNPLLFFGLSGISVVFPVIRVFPVSLGTRELAHDKFDIKCGNLHDCHYCAFTFN